MSESKLTKVLEAAIVEARKNTDGKPASYIPELASVNAETTGAVILTKDGSVSEAGDADDLLVTLQSTAKIAILASMLEEFGPQKVYSWVRVEPSGDDFASIARLDQFGPLPSNPMLNAGAISLCSHIPGNHEQQFQWLEQWMEKLYGCQLKINHTVFTSERRTGDRNRSLAYLMKSTNVIAGDVDTILENYFYLCSFEATLKQIAYLPMLLANGGVSPKGERILSAETVHQVVSIMATCGLYNESGAHLVRTGMPAKSGVSGLIMAVIPNRGGMVVMSPRVNRKGTTIRGSLILEYVSREMGWHFAS